MKVKIALVTLLLVLIPVGMAMAQQPTNLVRYPGGRREL